jgi:hypothetical protein
MRVSAFLDSFNDIMQLVFGVVGIERIRMKLITLNKPQVNSHVAFDSISLIGFRKGGSEHTGR